MGFADVIPGVSGGTIALITGIYPRLIHGLSAIDFSFILSFFRGKFKEGFSTIKKIDFNLFIPLGLGISIAVLFFSRIIKYLLENHSGITFAFFFGLILASAIFLFKKVGKLNFEKVTFAILGFLVAYVIAGAAALQVGHSLPIIFLAGIAAICAMLLPGISGAFVLLLLGQYEYMITALHNYSITIILVFITGAITGLISSSKLINYLLRNLKQFTFAFLVGLMIGSLRLPLQEMISDNQPTWILAVTAAVGFLIVFVLESALSTGAPANSLDQN